MRFELGGGDGGEDPKSGPRPSEGCNVELTELTVEGKRAWTFGLESFAFGVEGRQIELVESGLRRAAAEIERRGRFDIAGLTEASYPAWLAQLAVAEASNADPLAAVRALVDCENTRARDRADSLLSPDFTGLTRRTGVERSRSELLDDIANSNLSVQRRLDDAGSWTRTSGDLAVARSVVTTTDTTKPGEAPGRFRNTHVFELRADAWRCLAWQVTELK